MVQGAPAVFPRPHLRAQVVFVERHKRHRMLSGFLRRHRDLCLNREYAGLWGRLQAYVGTCLGTIDMTDGLPQAPMVAKILPLQHQLRGVDGTRSIAARDGTLPLTEFGLGKAIRPAEIIPVINMEGQGNNLIRAEPAGGKSAYPVIYWGATASTLRSIQFQQGDSVGRTLGRKCLRFSRLGHGDPDIAAAHQYQDKMPQPCRSHKTSNDTVSNSVAMSPHNIGAQTWRANLRPDMLRKSDGRLACSPM